jgi:hypothetical protein
MLLIGPMAGAIAPGQPQEHAFDIVFAGFAFQGIGFMVSFQQRGKSPVFLTGVRTDFPNGLLSIYLSVRAHITSPCVFN